MQVNQPKVSAAKASTATGHNERVLFEAWVRQEWLGAPLHHVRDALPVSDPRYGEYCNENIQRAWVGWQARAALSQPSLELELPEVVAVARTIQNDDPNAVFKTVSFFQTSGPFDDGEKLMAIAQHDRIVGALRYKGELYDEVWALVTSKGYMNVTTAISKLEQERDAARDRVTELERKLKGQWTYASDQATHCGGCGKHKHTPLRVDWMGGYVCLTCIDEKLEALYESAQAGQVPEEARTKAMQLRVFLGKAGFGEQALIAEELMDMLAAASAQGGE